MSIGQHHLVLVDGDAALFEQSFRGAVRSRQPGNGEKFENVVGALIAIGGKRRRVHFREWGFRPQNGEGIVREFVRIQDAKEERRHLLGGVQRRVAMHAAVTSRASAC